MRKLIIISILASLLLMLSGCGVGETRANEWISPEGVHYWQFGSAMAPRYDHDGNLVIDRSDNE